MKRLMTILLTLLLCAACIPAVAEDTEIAADGGLTLLSPETFFDGKYTFSNAVDNSITVGSTWITYSFHLVGEGEKEAVEADAESYRQALVDSGYFMRAGEYDLAYTGDHEVAVATAGGKEQGWQVNVNVSGGYSDIPYTIRVNLVEDFAFSDIEAGGEKADALPRMAEEVILPDPGYYFGRSYDGDMIAFDEYPKEEFDAYTTLLIEVYGMEIYDEHVGKYDEYYDLTMPGVAGSEAFVACGQFGDGTYGMLFDFSKNITLSALEVYKASAGCAICGGDAVCDICGGKGYLEMTAYGSKDTARVVCTGGCADGKCTACGAESNNPIPAQNAKTYTPPIVGNDGLLVMSPEQYLEIEPCNQITISDDACYVYHYDKCGREWSGRGSNEKWAMMESYVQALVDSGYYEVSDYEQDSYATIWCIRYIGPAETITGGYDIQVKSYGGRCSVYYRMATVSADDLDEKLIYFGVDDPAQNSDDPFSILATCDVCNGSGDCTYCWGKGTDGITGKDCAVCNWGKCSACDGKGHK